MSQTSQQAENLYAKQDYTKAIELVSPVIEVSLLIEIELNLFCFQHCPWAIRLRELRADSYLKSGDTPKAINDLKATAKLIPDNTQAFLQISQLLYSMGDADDSLM